MMTDRGFLHREKIRTEYRTNLNEMGAALAGRVERARAKSPPKSKRKSMIGVLGRRARAGGRRRRQSHV